MTIFDIVIITIFAAAFACWIVFKREWLAAGVISLGFFVIALQGLLRGSDPIIIISQTLLAIIIGVQAIRMYLKTERSTRATKP